jgi:hypothetical protein
VFFQLIPASGELWVEGSSEAATVGRFAGQVVAIGLQEYDPIAAPGGARPDPGHEPEGLAGWGTTHFLVCDEDKPAPVWVTKSDVDSHRYSPSGRPREDARAGEANGASTPSA